MRIIAGRWRSRLLAIPNSDRVRPMPDRVKESVFNTLGSYYGTPGELPALRVADAFAGGGTLGLEALSRGAAFCRFFEQDPTAIVVLKKNLASLGAGSTAEISTSDAWKMGASPAAPPRFDLIFLDPPFAQSLDKSKTSLLGRCLERLGTFSQEPVLVVFHYEYKRQGSFPNFEGWKLSAERRFGRNCVAYLER